MADTTFRTILPALKAVDSGDGTFKVMASSQGLPVGGTDLTFTNILPPLKAVDNGDDTYSISCVPV